jgi:molybdenum cofactor cytidylyltransferase
VINALVLAAGRSQRFGGKKMLARLPTGKTVLETTIDQLSASVENITLVIRPEPAFAALVARMTREFSSVRCIENAAADSGMASSIVCGVQQQPDAHGWLVVLGDMPFVLPSTYARITQALTHAQNIVVPVHAGQRGQPVGFGSAYRDGLLALAGDTGARALLVAHADHVVEVDANDPGIHQDIDTPTDLPTGT